jgi:hypothetical protein
MGPLELAELAFDGDVVAGQADLHASGYLNGFFTDTGHLLCNFQGAVLSFICGNPWITSP